MPPGAYRPHVKPPFIRAIDRLMSVQVGSVTVRALATERPAADDKLREALELVQGKVREAHFYITQAEKDGQDETAQHVNYRMAHEVIAEAAALAQPASGGAK